MRKLVQVFIAFGIFGIFWTILSGIRWMLVHPDTSQAIMGMLIGISGSILMFGFGYIYEQLVDLRQKQKSMDERWDSFILGRKEERELKEARNFDNENARK